MQDEINLIQTISSVFTSGIYTGAAGLALGRISWLEEHKALPWLKGPWFDAVAGQIRAEQSIAGCQQSPLLEA